MENKAHALAAGLFTLLLATAVILAAMWFSGETYESTPYVLESKFAVTGLNEQAPVRYRGVTVGKVTKIRFDPQDPRIVLVEIAIQSSIKPTRETFAELRYQGVTGLAYIMLDDAQTESALLLKPGAEQRLQPVGPHSARIPIRESIFASLAEVAQQVLADAREMAKRINTLLSDRNQQQITRALENVATATHQVTALAKALEPAAKNSDALVADARKTFQQAEKLLAEVANTNRELAKRLDAIERVAGSAEKAGGAVAALADTLATETVPRINLLAEDLARASRSLDRLAHDLSQQPQSLVFGRKPGVPGPAEAGFEGREKGKTK